MDLKAMIENYRKATEQFIEVATQLSDVQLDMRKDQGWSARQVIHHVADSEAQSSARLRRLIAEPGTQIQGYDEGAWGENVTLGYSDLPIENSLAVFKAVRASSLEILKRISTAQLDNAGIHSESGRYTVKDWIETYTKHPAEHAEQIRSGLEL